VCLIAMAIGQSERFPWICIANRDEFTHRPTAPMSFWSDHPEVLAGRDLQSGGTWMGVSKQGRVAMLTNIRNSALNKGDSSPSRGQLINDFLIHGRLPSRSQSAEYSGFNLIVGNLQSLGFHECSNHHLITEMESSSDADFIKSLKPDFYSISNGSLHSSWPKTRKLENSLKTVLKLTTSDTDAAQLSAKLLPLLQDRGEAQDDELPNTGIPLDWERMLSAVQIVSPSYGTRSSTVMVLDKNKRLHIQEVSYYPDGSPMYINQFNTQY
jgi:uncharacterized protein with NRDE domain